MSNLMKKTGRVPATMLAALQIAAPGVAETGAQMQTNIRVKILAINDFHGQIGTGRACNTEQNVESSQVSKEATRNNAE